VTLWQVAGPGPQRGSALARHPPGLRAVGVRIIRDRADHPERAVSPPLARSARASRADNTVTTAAIASGDGFPAAKTRAGGWS
jgi:hypothetical protein